MANSPAEDLLNMVRGHDGPLTIPYPTPPQITYLDWLRQRGLIRTRWDAAGRVTVEEIL
jgi:hypothetical protein